MTGQLRQRCAGTASLVGVVSGDSGKVTLAGTPLGTFASSGVGTGIAVNITGLSLTGISAANYTLTAPASTASISPAALTVTANNQAVVYGAAIPVLTGTITGAVAGDGITASYATTAVAGSPVGAYSITATLNPNSKLSNYSVSITNGTLAIYSATVYPLALLESQGSAVEGDPGFTLTVTGANFGPGSVVLWNGSVRATQFVSSTQLTAEISASDISAAGTNLVTVANGAPNASTSAALLFLVQSSSQVPTITEASVSDFADGGGNHSLSVAGAEFLQGATVQWNGVALATTYISSSELSAVVPSSDYGCAAGGGYGDECSASERVIGGLPAAVTAIVCEVGLSHESMVEQPRQWLTNL